MLGLAPVAAVASQHLPVEAAPKRVTQVFDVDPRAAASGLGTMRGGVIPKPQQPYLIGERGPEIVISINNTADPAEVVRIIKQYQRRGATMPTVESFKRGRGRVA